MKTEYNIKDKVWIHLGEYTLTEGRVVEIITLDHLKENHRPGHELYVIEIKTGIDDVYEVRDFDHISPDAKGPIMFFRNIKTDVQSANRYLKKIGILLPDGKPNTALYINDFDDDGHDGHDGLGSIDEPTTEQIHAAMERATAKDTIFNPTLTKAPAKKPRNRNFVKRKKNDNINSNT